jgi:hypothetical protein
MGMPINQAVDQVVQVAQLAQNAAAPGGSTPGGSTPGAGGKGFANLPHPPTPMAPQSGTPGRPVPAAPFTPRGPGYANPGAQGAIAHPQGEVPGTPPIQTAPLTGNFQPGTVMQPFPQFANQNTNMPGLGGKFGGMPTHAPMQTAQGQTAPSPSWMKK